MSLAVQSALVPTAPALIDRLKTAQVEMLKQPQAPIFTQHLVHGGMYSRTITMPPRLKMIGAHVRVPTIVITVGTGWVRGNEGWKRLDGYNVIPGHPSRKQAFATWDTPLVITAIFPTQAKTVEEAEKEFTDEYELLMSNWQDLNEITVTGE